MYLDESGDHSLTVIDPSYPVFVLGGIIVDQAYAEGEMTEHVQRFCFSIGPRQNGGVMVAEKRNATLDHQLELAWLNLKISGTAHVKATEIEHRIAGLQLADLVVSPIGRHVMGKPAKEDFRIVESKFRRAKRGGYMGTGLIVLPKQ